MDNSDNLRQDDISQKREDPRPNALDSPYLNYVLAIRAGSIASQRQPPRSVQQYYRKVFRTK